MPVFKSGFVTTTSKVPATWAGVVAVMEVELKTVTPFTNVPPIATVTPGKNPVPVIVTNVPPASGPEFGLMLVTTGVGEIKVNPFRLVSDWLALLPEPGLVTVTSTLPAACAGVVAVIVFPLFEITTEDAATPPKVSVASFAKLVPFIVTDVPPCVDPEVGLIVVIVGCCVACATLVKPVKTNVKPIKVARVFFFKSLFLNCMAAICLKKNIQISHGRD